MKKLLKVGKLHGLSPKACLLAYRNGDGFNIQNLEADPQVRFEKTDTELVIRITMNSGDFLAIDETPGVAEKFSV